MDGHVILLVFLLFSSSPATHSTFFPLCLLLPPPAPRPSTTPSDLPPFLLFLLHFLFPPLLLSIPGYIPLLVPLLPFQLCFLLLFLRSLFCFHLLLFPTRPSSSFSNQVQDPTQGRGLGRLEGGSISADICQRPVVTTHSWRSGEVTGSQWRRLQRRVADELEGGRFTDGQTDERTAVTSPQWTVPQLAFTNAMVKFKEQKGFLGRCHRCLYQSSIVN